MPLNDSEIRPTLISFLNNSKKKTDVVIEELPVCFGNAIADIVFVDKSFHCYEIKGETDSISRIHHQALFYNQSFQNISLVTTSNHIKYASCNVPPYWGIIVAELAENNMIKLKRIRKASSNPCFSKEKALQTLWKDEMLCIADREGLSVSKKMSKTSLSSILSSSLSKTKTIEYISSLICERIKKKNLCTCMRCEN